MTENKSTETTTSEVTVTKKSGLATWLKNTKNSIGETAQSVPGVLIGLISGIMNTLSILPAWIAGADLTIMKEMPSGEINKKLSIGLTMIFTVAISAIAAGYAANLFLSPAMAVPFALLWAGVIFGIDRALIVFMDTKQAQSNSNGEPTRKASMVFTVVARIIIILCMTYITSTAVEMLIFEKEIEAVITEQRQQEEERINDHYDSLRVNTQNEQYDVLAKVNEKTDAHKVYIAQLDKQIADATTALQQKRIKLEEETAGRVGSGKVGRGAAAKAIEANIAAAEDELRELKKQRDVLINGSVTLTDMQAAQDFANRRLAELDAKLEDIAESRTFALSQIEEKVSDGFKDRYIALRKLWGDAPLLMLAVFSMLMLIEAMPILLKLFSGQGAYERALAAQYAQQRVDVELKNALEQAKQEAKQAKGLNQFNKAKMRETEIGISERKAHLTAMLGKKAEIASIEHQERMETIKRLKAILNAKSGFINAMHEKLVDAHDGSMTKRDAQEELERALLQMLAKI